VCVRTPLESSIEGLDRLPVRRPTLLLGDDSGEEPRRARRRLDVADVQIRTPAGLIRSAVSDELVDDDCARGSFC
jgi:hypothetical protein